MAKRVERFEDLEVWQKARELVQSIYNATKTRPFGQDHILRDQMRRAAISVMANIAEGFGRRTHKEFAHFLVNARGSVTELQSHLYVAFDQNYIDQATFRSIYEQCEQISRKLWRLIDYLHQPRTSHSAPRTKGVISVD
ncbi:MAG: four helix bundle protein [Armatimonadetes bacterium]|nr:four helix bundle protein [Armatimonadota bacterium]MCX7969085.1 four helix bundle protein [Armatimonadota bacterium]MDW8143455.1 four helix bundle protein [Armatimonadota bacterium]